MELERRQAVENFRRYISGLEAPLLAALTKVLSQELARRENEFRELWGPRSHLSSAPGMVPGTTDA